MMIGTKLRLLSMKRGLLGEVAKIILSNVRHQDDNSFREWMKDVINNGCAYSSILRFQTNNELHNFYERNKNEIELKVWLHETENNQALEVIGDQNNVYAMFAFEKTIEKLYAII